MSQLFPASMRFAREIFRAVALTAALATPSVAAESLRVAKVVPFAWTFTPLEIGIQTGIFAKHGLDIEASASAGDAKLQQLLTSGSVDIGIGSGPGMAFAPKECRLKRWRLCTVCRETWR